MSEQKNFLTPANDGVLDVMVEKAISIARGWAGLKSAAVLNPNPQREAEIRNAEQNLRAYLRGMIRPFAEKEVLIAPAIKDVEGRVWLMETGASYKDIHRQILKELNKKGKGFRHDYEIAAFQAKCVHGFATSHMRFVDAKEALKIAEASNQVKPRTELSLDEVRW